MILTSHFVKVGCTKAFKYDIVLDRTSQWVSRRSRGFKVSLTSDHKIDLCFQRLLSQIVFLFAHKIEN